jgi:hypothetical protein
VQPWQFERDAPGSRTESRSGDVDEDSAAPSGDARPGVVIKLDDQVVEPIVSPKAISRLVWTPLDGMIIPTMPGVFDPGVVWSDGPRRQQGQWVGKAVSSPP